MRHLFLFIWRLLRIGCTDILIVVEGGLLALFALDIFRFQYLGMTLAPACRRTFSSVDCVLYYGNWAVAGLVGLIVPLTAGAVRTALARPGLAFGLRGRGRRVRLVHLFLTGAITVCVAMAGAMQDVAGWSYHEGTWFSSFNSHLALLLGNAAANTWLAGGLLASLVLGNTLFEFLIKQKRAPRWFYAFVRDLRLADLEGQLRPMRNQSTLNFNSAAVAPGTRFVRRESLKILNNYQALVPGSSRANDYLAGICRECRDRIVTFARDLCQDPFRVYLLPGTTRAIEAGAMSFLGNAKVVVSPFEHPALIAMAKSHPGGNWKVMNPQSSIKYLNVPWDQAQTVRLVDEFMKMTVGERAGSIVLSEVHYASGLVLPIEQIKEELIRRQSTTVLIVDGAHGPGNIEDLKAINVADIYVTSGHKWLMSSEPSGILLVKNTLEGVPSYDTCVDALAYSTVSASSIAGLHASLRLFGRIRMKEMINRSADLRRLLLDTKPEEFRVVGEVTKLGHSSMLSVQPTKGFTWNKASASALKTALVGKGISVECFEFEADEMWVRISLGYFLERNAIERLWKHLRSFVDAKGGVRRFS